MKHDVRRLAVAGCLLAGSLAVHADMVVKIGFAGPLTGPIAHVGKDEQFGTQLALDDANARGVTLGGAEGEVRAAGRGRPG